MVSFLALYRGPDLPTAELVAVSADAALVAQVATALLRAPGHAAPKDRAIQALTGGRRRALRFIAAEVKRTPDGRPAPRL
jgi:hypothetical protein